MEASGKARESLGRYFKGALPLPCLIRRVHELARGVLGDDKHFLYATSSCVDEVNRDLDLELQNQLRHHQHHHHHDHHHQASEGGTSSAPAAKQARVFPLGGLAGFPFTGVTGFYAYRDHVPNGGAMVIFAASHVGVDSKGNVGRLDRVGMDKGTNCCGAAIGAWKEVQARKDSSCPPPDSPMDQQQNYIKKVVFELGNIEGADHNETMANLARKLSERILHDLEAILEQVRKCDELSQSNQNIPLVIISGVQINWEDTAGRIPDYYLPLVFEVREGPDRKEELLAALLKKQ